MAARQAAGRASAYFNYTELPQAPERSKEGPRGAEVQRCRCGGGVQVKVLLTSSPSSLVFSTGFSLSLVRGLVTTRIPPTCARVRVRARVTLRSQGQGQGDPQEPGSGLG